MTDTQPLLETSLRLATLNTEPLWHPRDAGLYLGIHEKTVLRMARERKLPALRLGKHWRFRASDLVAFAGSLINSSCQPDRVMET
jgi:excisionase family DNA binding protein